MKTNKRLNWINDTRLLLLLLSSGAPIIFTLWFIGLSMLVDLPLILLYVVWLFLTPPNGIDYKSVTGPFKLIVLVPLLVVITFGVTFVMVVEIRCFNSDSAMLPLFRLLLLLMAWLVLLFILSLLLLFILLLLVLFNRIADGPVVMVSTLFPSNCDCVRLCSDFNRCSKLIEQNKEKHWFENGNNDDQSG